MCVSLSVIAIHLAQNMHQYSLKSTEGQNHSPVDLPIIHLLKVKHLCLCLCLCTLFQWVWSPDDIDSVSLLHRVSLHFLIDPVDIMCDAGVDTRLVLLPTPVAPADYAHQSHPAIAGADQWATRVSLRGHKKDKNEFPSKCPTSGAFSLLSLNNAHKTRGRFSPCRHRPGLVCHQRTACWKSRCVQTELLGCSALQATVARILS